MQYGEKHPYWQVGVPSSCTKAQRRWLTQGGSLTAHLRKLGNVEVCVTLEDTGLPWFDERSKLVLPPTVPIWVREVTLNVNKIPYVYARSIMTLSASRYAWRGVRFLGNQPLADLLFRHSGVRRSAFESTCLTAKHPLYQCASLSIGRRLPDFMLSRRSVFQKGNDPLLIVECMLPALWAHLAT